MCKPLITEELPKRPPMGADTTVPRWAIQAYQTPQAQPLPVEKQENPLAWIAGAIGWMCAVLFGKRIEKEVR
jgi:hypothetical protein